MRATVAVCAVIAALAIAAAGCGGDDSETSGVPVDEWTEQLCASVLTWTGALTDATSRLGSPQDITLNGFRGAVTSTVSATKTFVEDVRALGPPDTEVGDEIESELTELADTLEENADALSGELEGATGLPDLLPKIGAITGTFSAMGSAVGSSFDRLSNLEGTEELEQAFESADSCRRLGPTR